MKKSKGKKILKIALIVIAIPVALVVIFLAGYTMRIIWHPGNASQYSFEQIQPLEDSPLAGEKICVLGSSIVDGVAARHHAVAEYFAARFDCDYTKEAVIGTTLADTKKNSYVARIRKLDPEEPYKLLLCQLATNDATKGSVLGEISQGQDFDTSTTTGAIEYIICYARQTWDCPVVFFTNTRFDSPEYDAMVKRLYELQEKYGIGIIDLWQEDINNISDEQRKVYLFNSIHPTMAGYRDWWGPEMERQFLSYWKEISD